jgi:hypothetical protein
MPFSLFGKALRVARPLMVPYRNLVNRSRQKHPDCLKFLQFKNTSNHGPYRSLDIRSPVKTMCHCPGNLQRPARLFPWQRQFTHGGPTVSKAVEFLAPFINHATHLP